MIKFLNNQKGSIGIAIVIALIGILSGISLASVAFRDSRSARLQIDGLQKFHFLRTEVYRVRQVISRLTINNQINERLPLDIRRNINVNYGDHRTVYEIRSRANTRYELGSSGYLVSSMVNSYSGGGHSATEESSLPIVKFGEYFIYSSQTLAIFHYFSDIDRALDDVDGNIRFYGADVIHGRVHSNSDIWIRQIGGGSNNGWPTFYGLVTTAGEIKVYGGGTYPLDDVFRGGLIEGYPRVIFEPTAELVRQNGRTLFGDSESDNMIAFVNINGLSYNARLGHIQELHPPEEFIIYDQYPPYGPIGNQIGINYIALRDTTWTVMSGTLANDASYWVPFELWISGTIRGAQTWGSSHNIYIKDDITYEHTIPGQPPDGGEDGDYPVNTNDYFGLISEESIYIQYGHYCPIDTIRKKPNTDNIYIYGALCAMGDSQGETTPNGIYAGDGIFTFQYHFPKGSTPAQFWFGEWFTMIDLHRFKYPTSILAPWPPGLDYPWYNPIWPEPGPVAGVPAIPNPHGAPTVTYLRGEIRLFGSIAQRRRGFVRRSGNADYDTGIWDIDNHIFGLHSNALNPAGGPSGYDKDYTFDTRFETKGPPDFPLVKYEYTIDSESVADLGFFLGRWTFRKPPENF
ncbi:MAG: hypothetical protein K0B81_02570 [Candidatus Cloacimonetes bacterium]|nr:hypothetical protein [Candidatus Cloacimonadota bacterium]